MSQPENIRPNSSFAPTLITRDGEVLPDGWQLLNDEDTITGDGPHVLSFARALSELDGLNHSCGVRVMPGDDVRLLAPFLDKVALIEVVFPGYRDGRGYSTARILRDDLAYTGPIRAIGDVLRDQLYLMLRCGFDEFVVRDHDPAGAIAAASNRFSVAYQSAADSRVPVWQLRHGVKKTA